MNQRDARNPDRALKKQRARIRNLERSLVQAIRCLARSPVPADRLVALSLAGFLSASDRRKLEG